MYDLIIIGGGPGGYTAAQKAARAGLKTLIIEKSAVGGTCLNEGCIPAKTLLHSAKIWHSIETASKYGIEAEAKSFKQDKVIGRKNKIVRKLTAGVRTKIEEAGATLLMGEAVVEAPKGDTYKVRVGEELFEGKYLILATGGEAIVPPIKGIDTVEYWTSRETLQAKELPSSIAIVGGGVIGMEFAAYFSRIGVKVAVIEMLPEILGGMDGEVSVMLREEYDKVGVDFYLKSKVTEVSPKGLTIEKDGESTLLPAERIIICAGRRPVATCFSALNLELEGRGVKVNSQMQTSLERVYAIGDLTGFSQLAHTAVREAEVAVDNILGKTVEISYKAVPGVVYTYPEVAGVGYTEEQLQKEGIRYEKRSLNMTYAGRFVVENEQANGLCKVLVSEDDQILGIHMFGNPASELIISAGIAIDCRIPAHRLAEVIFPHPTVGEIIKETIEAPTVDE